MLLNKLSYWGGSLSSTMVACIACLLVPVGASAFDAFLEGKSNGDSSWTGGSLHNYIELDSVKCRVHVKDGPAQGQEIVLSFDHSKGLIPCIQNLRGFVPSDNVVITSGPTLTAPAGQDVWSYTFTIDVTDDNDGEIEFKARLASGSHLIESDSVKIEGSDSLGTLEIDRPAEGGGECDLVVYKNGPSIAAPGDTITYTLNYFNQTNAPKGADRAQLSDILPAEVTYVQGSASDGGTIVGNTLTWDLPDHIDEGQTGSVTYQVRLNPDLAYGQTFANLAQIYSSEEDEDYSDNSFSLTTTVIFNRAPVANDDAYTINEDEPLSIEPPGVMANDSDADGNTLSAYLVSGPSHGVLSFHAEGSFTYTPATNFNGLDFFTYQASDGDLMSGLATVAIMVMPVNDPPVANDDSYGTDENHSLSVSAPGVLANDSDVEGDSFQAVLATGAAHGAVTLNPDGSFSYIPATSFYGTDSFTYVANDGLSNSLPATVTVNVRRVNVPPSVRIISPTNGTFYFAPATIPIVAEAVDTDGSVVKIEFFAGTNALPQTNLTASYVVWTNVAAGVYALTARATDNDGATGISDPVTVTVLERPPSFAVQPIHFNPQTGLFEEVIRVSNPSTKPLDGVRVLITGLRTNVKVFNASGSTNGIPYVQTALPIAAGASMDLRIQYYVPDYQEPNPTMTMELVPPAQQPIPPTGTIIPVTRTLRAKDGTFLVEFNSISNRIYFIQYCDDIVTWKTAWPSITGNGSHLQWVDVGSPSTESFPGLKSARFYRVLMAP